MDAWGGSFVKFVLPSFRKGMYSKKKKKKKKGRIGSSGDNVPEMLKPIYWGKYFFFFQKCCLLKFVFDMLVSVNENNPESYVVKQWHSGHTVITTNDNSLFS